MSSVYILSCINKRLRNLMKFVPVLRCLREAAEIRKLMYKKDWTIILKSRKPERTDWPRVNRYIQEPLNCGKSKPIVELYLGDDNPKTERPRHLADTLTFPD